VLCTDVSRDGALSGPNTPLYAEILRRYPGLKLQASGGVRGIDDVRCIASTGASGVITGRAMLDGLITAEEMRTFRQSE
jgi:phosphoribosylformimino-5-aminoimidazole carboxamide ribotide isomerase